MFLDTAVLQCLQTDAHKDRPVFLTWSAVLSRLFPQHMRHDDDGSVQ